ncbi:MAG: glycosyltransferase family 9 protein [Candidatus Omnitrophica bacterium]|nr:glycosyltransferase family 9 protein [Candidatus Omnitrophota bacterium]
MNESTKNPEKVRRSHNRGFLNKHYAFKRWPLRFLAACFDTFGTLLSFPFRWMRPALNPDTIRNILVIRTDGIGDVLMTRPALNLLRQQFPSAKITWVIATDLLPLMQHRAEVDELIGWMHHWFSSNSSLIQILKEGGSLLKRLRAERYDLGIDFRGDLRHILWMALGRIRYRAGYGITGGGFLLTHKPRYPWERHQVLVNHDLLHSLGMSGMGQQMPFVYSKTEEQQFWSGLPMDRWSGLRPRLVIHPAASYPSKCWPPKKFRQLLERILAEGCGSIALIGTADEANRMPELGMADARVLDLRGKTRLQDLPILFDACDLFVGNDSGPAHLAAAQGLEAVVMASGTNDFRFWHPWSERVHLMRYHVPCMPCESRICPLGHHDCLEKVSVDSVFHTIRGVLQAKGLIPVRGNVASGSPAGPMS